METVNTSPLFSYAAAAALSNGSLYRDRTRDRDELLAFMDANEWFGSSYEQNGDEFMVVMTAEITVHRPEAVQEAVAASIVQERD